MIVAWRSKMTNNSQSNKIHFEIYIPGKKISPSSTPSFFPAHNQSSESASTSTTMQSPLITNAVKTKFTTEFVQNVLDKIIETPVDRMHRLFNVLQTALGELGYTYACQEYYSMIGVSFPPHNLHILKEQEMKVAHAKAEWEASHHANTDRLYEEFDNAVRKHKLLQYCQTLRNNQWAMINDYKALIIALSDPMQNKKILDNFHIQWIKARDNSEGKTQQENIRLVDAVQDILSIPNDSVEAQQKRQHSMEIIKEKACVEIPSLFEALLKIDAHCQLLPYQVSAADFAQFTIRNLIDPSPPAMSQAELYEELKKHFIFLRQGAIETLRKPDTDKNSTSIALSELEQFDKLLVITQDLENANDQNFVTQKHSCQNNENAHGITKDEQNLIAPYIEKIKQIEQRKHQNIFRLEQKAIASAEAYFAANSTMLTENVKSQYKTVERLVNEILDAAAQEINAFQHEHAKEKAFQFS